MAITVKRKNAKRSPSAAAGGSKSKKGRAAVPDLVVRLADPGMTPLLRAGLGGLGASLRALAREDGIDWPRSGTVRVPIGPGVAEVDAQSVTLRWNGSPAIETLKPLFERSFRISHEGLITLPGAWDDAPISIALASALQGGLKRTFLQHGKTTTKAGAPITVTVEIDDRQVALKLQRCADLVHRKQGASLVEAALTGDAVKLAGWAYPGAAQRHIAFGGTKFEYGPGAALAACFSLVGCLSLRVARENAAVLVVPEPDDLLRFAITRPRLTPRDLASAFVAGPGDAVLAVHVALALDSIARNTRGVAAVHGVLLRATPWDSKQKYRVATLRTENVPAGVLDVYHDLMQLLPAHIHVQATSATDDDGFFATASAFRAFVAKNLACGRRWYQGFATARTAEKTPRFIHYYRKRDNLGALYREERNGIIAMVKHLEDAEAILVRSVHVALRQRFGAIAEESDNPQTRRNRQSSERDRWRLAFAGAKTHEQIRAALADLWSRAGTNSELRAGWQTILPLLRAEHWQTARDLALVALASYPQKDAVESDDAPCADPVEAVE